MSNTTQWAGALVLAIFCTQYAWAQSTTAVSQVEQEPNRQSRVTSIFEKDQETEPGFWDGSTLLLKPRTYYLNRNRDTNPDTGAWALGGELAYTSGLWNGLLRVRGTLYTSQKLWGPEDKDGSALLMSGQEGFSVLGEANVTLRLHEHFGARLGRQRFELPYLGSHDIRMVPNTFEGVAFGSEKKQGFSYIAGYVSKIKRKNEDEFIAMSEAAGIANSDDGVVMAGARYQTDSGVYGGAIMQRTEDAFDTLFAKGHYPLFSTETSKLMGFLQYTHQASQGDELLGEFSTSLLSAKLELQRGPITYKLGLSTTDDEAGIRKPYGNPANYLSIIVEDFDRAGEDAWMLGLAYDFKQVGIGKLSAFTTYVSGNTPDSGAVASPDQSELDFTVDYRIAEGALKNVWLRARAALVDQEESQGGNDFLDVRFIANYSLDLI